MSVVNERNIKIVDEFRSNEGKVGGRFEAGRYFCYTQRARRVSRNALTR